MRIPPTLGKTLYALIFVAVLPVALWAWARGAEANVAMEAPPDHGAGPWLAALGGCLWLGGVLSLWRFGEGLPMNSYPPPRLVTAGAYRLLAHPIYTGFVMACAGLSLHFRSKSGLWLVTPAVALGAGALWWGYERNDLHQRLGPAQWTPLLALPARPRLALRTLFLALWRPLLRLCERLANSWREWEWGGVRVINHGALAALAVALGITYAVTLAGPETAWLAFLATAAIIAGAALWAQVIEGSPALARPYGFFGGVAAVVAVALAAAPAMGLSPWLAMGQFAVAAPWTQGLGRLRCIANGCCHGAPCNPEWGIRYTHPRTRPVRLATLQGTPLHPTQLYSLAGNAVLGVLLMRLWAGRVPLALVIGVYFIGMGLARFVEEAYRGEPQTPVFGGLRLYQWVALGCVIAGGILTAVPGTPAPPPAQWNTAAPLAGLASGAITWLAASVDFPRSKRRFARLA